jgi:tyrosine-protein kinase Etk/Wzc
MVPDKGFATIARFAPGTPFYQAFEMLTASLMLLDGKEGTGVHAVTVMAAKEGYGASTTALNVALILAGSGRRTLLMDANMRSPALHEPFDLPAGPGLAEVLTRKVAFKDAVRATRTSHLYLLPAGAPELSPHALLQPAAISAAFEQVKGAYEFVVVDTPPALRYPDAFMIARFTTGAVLVLPGDGAPRRFEMEVRRRLERADVNILGIVMNKTSLKDAAVS